MLSLIRSLKMRLSSALIGNDIWQEDKCLQDHGRYLSPTREADLMAPLTSSLIAGTEAMLREAR